MYGLRVRKAKMRKKRRRLNAKNGRRRHDKVIDRIVKLKVKYNLSAAHLRNFITDMYSLEEAEVVLRLVQKAFKRGGYCGHRLHGCAACNDFIWLHGETMLCPNCNSMDGRYLMLMYPNVRIQLIAVWRIIYA